ncbi:hypothetical protein MMC07_001932 [Pseudocyphellaria aurata]|nr:hypothetical protein [Pseudocyphellaria aurata]
MEEDLFPHSQPIDPDEVKRTRCFTTLPVRINRYDHVADEATRRFSREWAEVMDEGVVKPTQLCSERGNYSSYLYPESRPERMDPLAYLSELAFVHDDLAESMNFQGAMDEHDALAVAMDPHETQQEIKNARTARMKRLLAQSIQECIKIDPELGVGFVESYRKTWLREMDVPNTNSVKSLDDYAKFRALNGGIELFWDMVAYSHGNKLTKQESELVAGVQNTANWIMLLTNDYYSWENEYHASKDLDPGRIVNAVAVLMRTEGLSMETSKEKVKDTILAHEQKYLRERSLLYESHPTLPYQVRKHVELCGTLIAGVHYWTANAPRYSSWMKADQQNGDGLSVDGNQIVS